MAAEIGSIQPNPYIFNIENRRKRKARLAHEIGAGARCRKCEDLCPGFQLHFWRKICVNCRCGKVDHEVEEEEEDIGKIVIGKLFERPIRTKEEEETYCYGTDLEMINDSTGKQEKLKFDWVPPGVERAIAKRYMEMLPPDKRPVAGSEAAKERRRHLEKQLPLYDMDESERCETLPPAELENFQKYLEQLRTRVAGQGIVQEIAPSPKAEVISDNFPPPPDSWMHSSSVPHRNRQSLENSLNNNVVDPKSKFMSNFLQEGDAELGKTLDKLSLNNQNKWNAAPRPDTALPYKQSPIKSQYGSIRSEFAPPGSSAELPRTLTALTPDGSPTQSPSKRHNPSAGTSSVLQLTTPKPFVARSEQLQNVRPGQFSSSFPENQNNEWPNQVNENIQDLWPSNGPQLPTGPHESVEDRERIAKGSLPHMLPKDGRVVTSVAKQAPYVAQRETLVGHGGRNALGSDVSVLFPQECEDLASKLHRVPPVRSDTVATQQFSCQYCNLSMISGDVAVICERAGPGKYWHPQCFVCVTCKELLADLIYFYKEGKVFCGRHYTQAADIPRCKACDELIFSESWTRADGCDWHLHHFCCLVCDKPLAGSKYIPDEANFPLCLSCYMSCKAKMCETCENKITPEQTRAGYNGYFYHALPECFCCYRCRTSLIGQRFKIVKNWVFCSQDCVVASERDIALNPNPKKKE